MQHSKLRPFWSPWRVETNFGNQNSGKSCQLATNRLKAKLTWQIINNRTNLINSTSGSISFLFLFYPLVVQKLDMNAQTYCSKVKCWKRPVWRISPSCNISWSVLPSNILFFSEQRVICREVSSPSLFFLATEFFYGNHFTIKGCQKATFWKSVLGALPLFTDINWLTTSGWYKARLENEPKKK